MRKTFKVLLTVLIIVVSIFRVNAENNTKLEPEGIENDGSIARFELYDFFDRSEYFSGEEVIFYLGMSVSGSSESINGSSIQIKIPKKFIEKGSVVIADIDIQSSKEIKEDNENYIIVYTFPYLGGGLSFDVPLKFRTDKGATPHNYSLGIEASLIKEDDNTVLSKTSIDYLLKNNNPSFKKKVKSSSTGWVVSNGSRLDAGLEDGNNPGYLTTNIDDLKPIFFSYEFYIAKAVGQRYYEKLIFEDFVPEDSIFIQEDNPGWTFDEVSRVARYELNIDDTEILSANSISEKYKVVLSLKFPGVDIEGIQTNNATVTAYQKNKEEYETSQVLSDDIQFRLTPTIIKPFEPVVSKYPSSKLMPDILSERKKEFEWSISIFNPANMNDNPNVYLENVVLTDKDLDERLYYTGVIIPKNNNFVGSVDVKALLKDGTEQIIESSINTKKENTIRLDNGLEIDSIVISYTDGSYLPPNTSFGVKILTRLKDPSKNILINSPTEELYNGLAYQANYSNQATVNTSIKANMTFDEYKPKISILKSKVTPGKDFIAGDIIEYNVVASLVSMIKGQVIETNALLDILPAGAEYVPGSSSYSTEPEVIENFNNSGHTALKWTLEPIINIQSYQHASPMSFFNIRYKIKLTKHMDRGTQTNLAYLSWKNNDLIQPRIEKEMIQDIYDLNNDGNMDDIIMKASASFNYVPVKEIYATKEVMGSLDSKYIKAPAYGISEIGSTVSYKLRIVNNSDHEYTILNLIDLLPKVGDKTAGIVESSGGDFKRINRESTFALELKGPLEAPEGYQVYYTEDTIPDNISLFMENANWQTSLSNHRNVTAVKMELKEGHSLRSGEEISFIANFEVPKDTNLEETDIAVNSYGYSILPTGYGFVESNLSTLRLTKYKVEGRVFEDINKNGIYELNIDKPFENYKVQLVDSNGDIVKYLDGNDYEAYTDSSGYYSFDVYRQGNYKVKVVTPKGYLLTNKVNNDSGSSLNNDGLSDLFNLNIEKPTQIVNAGYFEEYVSLTFSKVLQDYQGNTVTNDTEFEFEIKINNELYNGTATLDGNSITIKDGKVKLKADSSITIDTLRRYLSYSIIEKETENHFVTPSDGTFHGILEDLIIEHTFINKEIERKDITVTKEWIGGPDIHPTIKIQLYRDGIAFGEEVILENETITYTWRDLLISDNKGKSYVYTVDEVEVPENYRKEVEAYVIRNIYTEEPGEPTDPEVPEEPGGPTDPEVPEEPGEPTTPEVPEEPGEPTNPEVPEEPGEPTNPEVPKEPGEPTDPKEPTEPEVPTSPELPNTGISNKLSVQAMSLIGIGVLIIVGNRRKKNT